jgi:hypothetical protein
LATVQTVRSALADGKITVAEKLAIAGQALGIVNAMAETITRDCARFSMGVPSLLRRQAD